MARAAVVSLCLLPALFLCMCRADHLNCRVTRDGDQMTYKVWPPIEDMTPHSFSWSISDTAVTTNTSPNNTKLGITSTYDSLKASKCNESLFLTSHYTFKNGTVKDFTANCSFSCSEADISSQVQDGTSKIGIGDGVGVGVGGVLLLVGLFFLYKFRDEVFRKCCCSQTGGLFTSVKVIHDVPRDEITVVHMPVSGES